jgi:hypothetical protein
MASLLDSLARDIGRAISPELPVDMGSLDDHLDFILSRVIPYGEDLREVQYWQGKRWREVRDDEGFHENILHIFNPGGEYLIVLDGNIMKGSWRQLNDNNTLIIEAGGRSELFDLRFLNAAFFVLTKHGDQARKGSRRCYMFAYEPITHTRDGILDWRALMERMFGIWRENSISMSAWIFFVLVVGVLIWLSVR